MIEYILVSCHNSIYYSYGMLYSIINIYIISITVLIYNILVLLLIYIFFTSIITTNILLLWFVLWSLVFDFLFCD